MAGPDTEAALLDWRYGQIQAERMCAQLLHIEGFEDVDPQHPLGGPDGLKDVVCKRGARKWIAAAYFPSTRATFSDVKSKFVHDLGGVKTNNAEGFAFLTGQRLTIGERDKLHSISGLLHVEIYHLERVRGLLDSPRGCGVRLEYLRIAMTEEEQWAFWNTMNADVADRLTKIDHKLDQVLIQTMAVQEGVRSLPSSLGTASRDAPHPTSELSFPLLCWLHQLVTDGTDVSQAVRGQIRTLRVWLGPPGSTEATATYIPPEPGALPALLADLFGWWRLRHARALDSDREDRIDAITELHHRILAIHPFMDANGRLARALADQAAVELLNMRVGKELVQDPALYFEALRQADGGNRTALARLVKSALM